MSLLVRGIYLILALFIVAGCSGAAPAVEELAPPGPTPGFGPEVGPAASPAPGNPTAINATSQPGVTAEAATAVSAGGQALATVISEQVATAVAATAAATSGPAGSTQTPTSAAGSLNTTSAPSPTIPPSAVPPTPAAPPSARLERGRWLQEIGDCAGARQELAGAVETAQANGGLEPAQLSEARYRLAQCYLRDDAPGEAMVVLGDLLVAAREGDPYRAPANFLLGETQLTLRRWDEAVASYTHYLELAPELAAYTWQRIAATRSAAGNLPGAREAYTNALSLAPDWSTTVSARRALAGLLQRQGDYSGAAAQYDQLRGPATSGPWAAEMLWLAGSALDSGGDKAGASQRWQAATAADPTSKYAHQALAALVDAGAPVDEFLRGVIDYHNDVYGLAIEAFDRLRASDPGGHNGEAWYYAGLSYLSLGQFDKATAELGNFIAAHPESSLWGDAWLAKARAQVRAGNHEAALATYRELANQRPDNKQAPVALLAAANLLSQDGDRGAAGAAYLDVARRYPVAEEAWRAYLTAGLNYFLAGDNRQAGQAWGEMATSNQMPAWAKTVAYYWLGRAQLASGETEAARYSWRAAAENDPSSYYGLRAAQRLAGADSSLFGSGVRSLPAIADARANTDELASWLRSWAGEGSLALPAAVQSDADWRRGQQFMLVGQRSPAISAWTRVSSRFGSDPWTLAALSLAFRDAGEYPLSIAAAEKLAGLAPAARELPAALEKLEYPLPLLPLIREQANKWQVNPLLVAALIRQESRFETAATSTAAAQGLMQIIPATADWIATQLRWPNFAARQIYWPYINVHFGVYYLSRQLDDFDENATAALAAYNGGPGNAAEWLQQASEDDDLFVAQIDISESRLYVQLVYQNYQNYLRLYGK